MESTIRGDEMAKGKTSGKPKRYGTLIRVSDDLAEALRDVTSLEKISVAEYGDKHILPAVRKRYRDLILKAAKKMEEQG